MTRNSASTLSACLASTQSLFRDVHVVDSDSHDDTTKIAKQYDATLTRLQWNGQYPKKKQWCLEHLPLQTDWVFFLDSDEIITDELAREMRSLFGEPIDKQGYFIKGRHILEGKLLRFGLHNNKLALFDKRYFHYPEIKDLHLPLGEVEGHYQPVARTDKSPRIGQLKAPLHHLSMQNMQAHHARHMTYATWEAGIIKDKLFPVDPIAYREFIKQYLRKSSLRPLLLFCISYFLKFGFLDGRQGIVYAKEKASYASQILKRLKADRKAE